MQMAETTVAMWRGCQCCGFSPPWPQQSAPDPRDRPSAGAPRVELLFRLLEQYSGWAGVGWPDGLGGAVDREVLAQWSSWGSALRPMSWKEGLITHQVGVGRPPLHGDNQKCLQTLPSVPWEPDTPLPGENHRYKHTFNTSF